MSEPFLGEIRMFGFTFAPTGWALANGQILSISQNTALFSLLGTTYGGDGTTTFALPNLQGRVPIHQGSGAGLTPRIVGQELGSESEVLLASQMPTHTHTVQASSAPATTTRPHSAVPARTGATAYAAASDGTAMNAAMISSAGGTGVPVPILQPFLVVNFCIALAGVFPSRN